MSIRKAQDERIEGTPDGLTAVTEISDVPDAPTIGTATATGETTATVTYTAAATGGTATTFTATSTPGSITGTGSSPITVSGLTGGTAYTFTVRGSNSTGTSPESAASNLTTTSVGVRGVIAGGYPGTNTNNDAGPKLSSMEYITISTTGNFTSFGNLSTAKDGSGFSSSTRALFTDNATSPQVEYITIATTGNGTTFGSLINNAYGISTSGASNETRGVIAGGYFNPGAEVMSNKMDYFTIASTGNSVAFGTLVLPRYSMAGMSSPTRGIFCSGNFNFSSGAGPCSEIEYITIASTGNATAFGDVTNDRDNSACASSNTRGLIATGMLDGSNISSEIDYITIASTGNGTNFGNMSSTRRSQTGLSSSIRAVFTVGNTGQGPYYRVPTGNAEYVTIATTGNSTDFGTLITQRFQTAGATSGHGGL